MVVTHTFYFMPCKSSLFSTVISFVYKDKWFSMKACQLFLYGKYLKKNSFIPSPQWIKLENFVMQLKRQSVEAWQNEGNNTSENLIPSRDVFKSVDHVKYERQVRSGNNICCLYSSLLELSSCLVTYENCHKSSGFSIKSEMSGWIWEIPTILS